MCLPVPLLPLLRAMGSGEYFRSLIHPHAQDANERLGRRAVQQDRLIRLLPLAAGQLLCKGRGQQARSARDRPLHRVMRQLLTLTRDLPSRNGVLNKMVGIFEAPCSPQLERRVGWRVLFIRRQGPAALPES